MLNRAIAIGAALIMGGISAAAAQAKDYPERTVNIVVPVPTGGGIDLTARILAQQLSTQLKQTYIVENKPGAGTLLGSKYVSDAKPDGYTLLYSASNAVIVPFMMPDFAINMETDLTPIAMVAYSPMVMAVNPKYPIKDPKELVAFVKAHPNDFRWGYSQPGSADHLVIEQFDRKAGINPLRVPYKGSGPDITAAISDEVSGILLATGAITSAITSGQLRAIAIAGPDMIEDFPGIQILTKYGFPGFEEPAIWYALWGPKNMPKELVDQVHQQVVAALSNPAVKEKFEKAGITLKVSKTPSEFTDFYKSELRKYGPLVKELNLRATD